MQKDDEISDEMETIRAVKAGDTDAYALLVERYHRPLLSFIFKMVGDRDMVEDLGQDVFLAVYRSLPMFDETKGVPFSAWIFTVARNRCLTVLRQRRTRKQEEPIAADLLDSNRKTPEEMVLNREQLSALAACLRQIPEPFRETILMSLEGKSVEDIAQCYGVAMGTVKSRLFRAKERMKLLVGLYFGYNEL